jgi:outer membrane protein OmpA-like peptidoglycan-associated protein
LGKATWDKVPDVDAIKALNQRQLDDLNNQLRNANNENARLKDMLAKKPEVKETIVPQSVKEFITTPISVFFDLNKTEIASQKDLVNVRALAKYAKENNSNVLVEGYADSATGTPAINESLSLRRANQVADELVKLGVDREKIKTAAHGGVNDLSPISFNRRATVQITE